MSPQSRGRALISETEQGKKNSVRTSPKLATTCDMWSIFSLSPIFWVYFYQLHRFVERGISSQTEPCFSTLSQVYSWAYIQASVLILYQYLSKTQWTPPSQSQKLENSDVWGKKKWRTRGQASLSQANKLPVDWTTSAPSFSSHAAHLRLFCLPRHLEISLPTWSPRSRWVFRKALAQH